MSYMETTAEPNTKNTLIKNKLLQTGFEFSLVYAVPEV